MELVNSEVRLDHYVECGMDSYVVVIPSHAAIEWSSHLSLLWFDAVDCVIVGPSPDGHALRISRQAGSAMQSDRGIYWHEAQVPVIQLPAKQMELWMWHPLQHIYSDYVMEKRGYTDHIDVEVDAQSDDSRHLNITLAIV